ncbi:FHA domain-containing protein [Desulfosporosinus orientis DSM 765]|uniref:FHA domain-containing protein n=1 Tax=Desulfosporosinus orientis (strain ATCC 19365 / DSM 765 / NCIMB 8382 / VKM B-1628 / Singapore I) TaxID=768706 RepID=G7WG40_DESOD|nr:FHA domain-containing protein [Desulfosporosinus orientis]AET70134.1 FHA domain-containing protein [Desulfosporosinus orientis DSM 765]
MQFVLVMGRLVFVALIYLFIFRIFTALLADLQFKGFFLRATNEYGRLEVLTGAENLTRGSVFKVDGKGLRVGRGKHNDIVLPDHFASIDHAVFRLQKGQTILEDLGSTNGTWVNGEQIHSPVQMVAGDYVKIGSITFQYSRWQNESSKF